MNLKFMKSLAGYLLIAKSFTQDTLFKKSVILMIQHDEQGAFGLMVNQPSPNLKLFDALPELTIPEARKIPLLIGGPVLRHQSLFTLHSTMPENHEPSPEQIQINDDLFFEPNFEKMIDYCSKGYLEQIPFEDRPIIHFYIGYAGWAQGQLEKEIREDTWIIDVASGRDIIFPSNPEHSWLQALQKKGGIYRIFAETGQNPLLN